MSISKCEELSKHWVHKTKDEDKQNRNITQYVLDTTIRKQTQITEIQTTGGKDEPNIVFMRKS